MVDGNVTPEIGARTDLPEQAADHSNAHSSAGQGLVRSVGPSVAVAVAPALVYVLYGVRSFFQLSGADPFIYIGYGVNPSDLIERYGYTYYAVRFPLILPSNILGELFGAVHGYLALRWIISAIAALCVYHLLTRVYSWRAGVIGVALLLVSATYLASVMTVYSTTIGVPFVAAGFALLLIPASQRARKFCLLGSGALFSLTVNSNVFTALPIIAVIVVWVIFNRDQGFRELGSNLCWAVVGAVGAFLVGVVVYWLKFGDPNLVSPSLQAAGDVASTYQYPFKETSLRWLNFQPETWLAPIATILAGLLLRISPRSATTTEKTIAAVPLVLWTIYAGLQFLFNQYSLETYFYLSYLLGPTTLALAMIVQLLVETRSERHIWVIAPITVLGIPVVWTHLARGANFWSLNGLLPILVIGVAAITISSRSRAAAIGSILIVSALPFLVTVTMPRNVPLGDGQPGRMDPFYERQYFQYDDDSLSLYEIAVDFTASLPRLAAEPGSLVFWVDPGDYVSTLMQWTHLGWYSTMQSFGEAGGPFLDTPTLDRLKGRAPRHLVAISSNPDTIRDAESALADSGLPVVQVEVRSFSRGSYGFQALVVELEPASCDAIPTGSPTAWWSLSPCSDQ